MAAQPGGKLSGNSDPTELMLAEQSVTHVYGDGLSQADGELTGLRHDANRLRADCELRDNAEVHLHEMPTALWLPCGSRGVVTGGELSDLTTEIRDSCQ
jgi:hypothetical protein